MDIEQRLTEIDEKLNRILAYIDKVDSAEYKAQQDFRSFLINLCADVLVDNNQRQQRLDGNN